MNNENNDTILPIGTVLRTKTGEVPLMVVNRAALYEENGDLGYFDYAAVVYPEGLNDDDVPDYASYSAKIAELNQQYGNRIKKGIETPICPPQWQF